MGENKDPRAEFRVERGIPRDSGAEYGSKRERAQDRGGEGSKRETSQAKLYGPKLPSQGTI